MVLIILFALTCTHLAAMTVGYRSMGLHSPLSIIAALNWVRVVPYAVLVVFDPELVDERVMQYVGQSQFDLTLTKYLVLELVGSTLVLLAVWVGNLKWLSSVVQLHLSRKVAAFFFGLGALLVAYRVQHAGGLLYLLEHMSRRSEITSGLGFLIVPTYVCLAASLVILASSAGSHARKRDFLVFCCALLASMIILAAFGGRKSGLLLLLTGVVAWSIYVKPIVLKPRALILTTLIFYTYMNGVWVLRQPGGLGSVVSDPGAVLLEVSQLPLQALAQLSYLENYLLAISHFDRSEYWYAAIFLSAPEALVPSVLHPQKPPMDEGVYLRSVLEGYYVYPPMPANALYPSSLPPETIGNGYAFLGEVGALLFYGLKGMLLVAGWKAAKNVAAPFSLVFLVYFLYGAEISLFRIVQILQVFIVCLIVGMVLALITKRNFRTISGGR